MRHTTASARPVHAFMQHRRACACCNPPPGVVCGAAASGNYVWNDPKVGGVRRVCLHMRVCVHVCVCVRACVCVLVPVLVSCVCERLAGCTVVALAWAACRSHASLARDTPLSLPSHTQDIAQLLVCCMMSGPFLTGYTQTINDYYDREIDAINEPYRPIPSGALRAHCVCALRVRASAVQPARACICAPPLHAGTYTTLASAPPSTLRRTGARHVTRHTSHVTRHTHTSHTHTHARTRTRARRQDL
jgi:hypothetical protein